MATNYDQEILGAEQQRMTSEALRQAANKPLEGQMVSGWYVPPSWTQYAAKGLESYLAGKDARDAKTQSATLREQKQKAIADMLKSYPTERNEPAYNSTENIDRQKLAMALTGQEQTQSPVPQAGGNVNIQPTNQDYIQWAINANQVDPSTAQMGLKMFEADANRKAAEAKTEEDRAFREKMLNAQFQQQKELAKMKPQGLGLGLDGNGNPVGKPMTADQEAKYRDRFANDYLAANATIQDMADVGGAATKVKNAKGLSGATGLSGIIPSYPGSDASNAEADLLTLEGKVTKLGKTAAAQSGAIGTMATQEWKIMRDMIASIDRTKLSPEKLKEQIGIIENYAEGAAARIADAYEKQYSQDFERYPQFKELKKPLPYGASAPAAQGAPAAQPSAQPTQGGYDADKEARYQAWKAQQGK